jgi:putative (di)nucleoside polyphosphate hydrolase
MNQKINKDKLPYRNKSSAVIIDGENNFLLVQLHSYNDDNWNFCGGGIEEGEDEQQALLRELEEELGINDFEIVKKSNYSKQYDWPDWMIAGDIEKGKKNIYRGQEEAYFLVKFTGNKDEIKIKPDELRAAKWIKYEQLEDHLNFDRHKNIVEDVIDVLIKEL